MQSDMYFYLQIFVCCPYFFCVHNVNVINIMDKCFILVFAVHGRRLVQIALNSQKMKNVSIFSELFCYLKNVFVCLKYVILSFFLFIIERIGPNMIYVYLFDILSTDYDITINRTFIFTFANSYDTNMSQFVQNLLKN